MDGEGSVMAVGGVSEMCAGICTAQHTYEWFIKGMTCKMVKCADAGKLHRVKRCVVAVKNCMRPLQEWLLN